MNKRRNKQKDRKRERDTETKRDERESNIPQITVCTRYLDPFYVVTYYMKWAKTSWTYSIHIHTYAFTVQCTLYAFLRALHVNNQIIKIRKTLHFAGGREAIYQAINCS